MMIKTLPPKKRNDGILRPLSEKEIQQKLYGDYNSQVSTAVKEEPVVKSYEPQEKVTFKPGPAIEKSWSAPKISAPKVSLPKIKLPPFSVRLPWKKILNGILWTLKALFGR